MEKKELTIKIEGMSCGHCTNLVLKTIGRVEGVTHTEVSLAEACAKVEYDANATSRENIIEAVIGTPFEVVGVS